MIWLELINSDMEPMSVIKLRRLCQKVNQKQNSGKLLLLYKTNGILNQLPDDIKHIQWDKYIQKYLSLNFPKQTASIVLTEKSMNTEQKVETLLNVLSHYDDIMNGDEDDDTVVDLLKTLFDMINKEFNMSLIMDVFFELEHGNSEYRNKIKNDYECNHYECNILESVVETRKYGLRSRIPSNIKNTHKPFQSQLSIEEVCIMELLEFIHIRLFHPTEHYKDRLPNKAGIHATECEIENVVEDKTINILFIDELNYNSSFNLISTFCDRNEYDTEALYNDIFFESHEKSNVFQFFESKVNLYYLLKDQLSKYKIQPIDETNLIDLDFGEHITDWKVKPMFKNMKEEWLQNEFARIDQDICKSLEIKSMIIANQNYNKSRYNFSTSDILCIKVYTDTDALQANFRKSFRSNSGAKRRSQFYHWAIYFSTLFLKIEVLNQVHNYNENICNLTLYHGLNRLFNTHGLVRQFYGALSTTWNLLVARNFAADSGMILQINRDVNFKNANAIAVDWISCHHNEQEVLLMNPQVIIEKSHVFSKDLQMKVSYFKSTLLSTICNNKQSAIVNNLSKFFESNWIPLCLENVFLDKEFMKRIQLFTPNQFLNGMSLFEWMFFVCGHYQIAKYVSDNGYKNNDEIFELIIGNDFFSKDNIWIQSVDRSEKFCSKYQPRMCTMNIVYEYDNDNTITKSFGTKEAKKMIVDTNLILQYIDQRKLCKTKRDLTININMQIKYQYKFDDGSKSTKRIW
eukprot:274258_1